MGKQITIIGSGYVGTTTAAILANAGHRVLALDINKNKIKKINSGKSPFYEAGLDELISHAISAKTLNASSDYKHLAKSDVVFSCVGTPDNPDGSSNLTFVFKSAETAIKYMKNGSIYVQKSTVPVGTGKKIEDLIYKSGKKIQYVSNPEFLREGTAVYDTLNMDRVVVGSNNNVARESIVDIYKSIEDRRHEIASIAGVSIPEDEQPIYFQTNRNSAELIKVTANAFLALKISFANSLAKLADQAGADINEIMEGVGSDKRIGRAFLNAGRGYGGGCFPKDVSGLVSSAAEHSVDLSVMIAASDVNDSMPGYIAQKAKKYLKDYRNKKVAVLGLAFKAGTSDARRSPGVKLANILSHNEANVVCYDPKANGEAKDELLNKVAVADSINTAIEKSEAIFITTDWPEFLSLDLKKLNGSMSGDVFVDCMNVFDIADVEAAGLQYVGVGR